MHLVGVYLADVHLVGEFYGLKILFCPQVSLCRAVDWGVRRPIQT
jgi:hypothetical protein